MYKSKTTFKSSLLLCLVGLCLYCLGFEKCPGEERRVQGVLPDGGYILKVWETAWSREYIQNFSEEIQQSERSLGQVG